MMCFQWRSTIFSLSIFCYMAPQGQTPIWGACNEREHKASKGTPAKARAWAGEGAGGNSGRVTSTSVGRGLQSGTEKIGGGHWRRDAKQVQPDQSIISFVFCMYLISGIQSRQRLISLKFTSKFHHCLVEKSEMLCCCSKSIHRRERIERGGCEELVLWKEVESSCIAVFLDLPLKVVVGKFYSL